MPLGVPSDGFYAPPAFPNGSLRSRTSRDESPISKRAGTEPAKKPYVAPADETPLVLTTDAKGVVMRPCAGHKRTVVWDHRTNHVAKMTTHDTLPCLHTWPRVGELCTSRRDKKQGDMAMTQETPALSCSAAPGSLTSAPPDRRAAAGPVGSHCVVGKACDSRPARAGVASLATVDCL
jgi:hypothetical protein